MKIFRGWKLKTSFPENQFSVNYTNFEERKGTGKTEYKLIFCYSYSTDSPVQKRVCIFLGKDYFGKHG